MISQTAIVVESQGGKISLITDQVVQALPQLKTVQAGMLFLFIRHTSASLAINENCDPDVRADLAMALNRIVPENLPYRHTQEGTDDMPSHVKASLMGPSLSIPIKDGCLMLGTWQGIYLCEHRRLSHKRDIILTIIT